MLGHIHRCQQWEREGRVVAYPGSIGRFHYGEEGEKSYLQWSVAPGNAVATPVVTPARETVCIDFNGPPDMDQLALAAATADDKFFRIRWTIDEEHRQLVDRDAICALFGAAAELKLEGRVLPAVRSRAEGISRAATLAEKVERWGELAAVNTSRLVEYLPVLESLDAQAIVDLELAELADAVVPAVSALPPPAVPAVTPPAPATAPVLDWLSDDLFAGEPA
jgi:exonuclease SbcD